MKLKRIFVIIGGMLSVFLGAFHLSFWNLFDWCNELPKLSVENSNIMQMSTIGIATLLLAFGIILIFYNKQIIASKIGQLLLLILALFYLVRLILEFVYPQGDINMGAILLVCVVVYLTPALMYKNQNKTNKKI